MRVFLFVCFSQALLCMVVLSHHEEHHDENVDDHPKEAQYLQKIAPGNVKFAYSFYTHLAEKFPGDSFLFSPASISMLFGMLSVGAKGQTQSQIYEALGFNMSTISAEDINKGFQQLIHVLNEPNKDLELSSANALFVEPNAKLLEKFSEDLKNLYESEAISMDFHNADEAKNQINSYVENKTNGKIKDLLPSVSPQTLLVLINTIYFKGTWVHAFDETRTKEADFHVDEKTTVKVPMMTIREEFFVAHGREMGCVVVNIPYQGNISAILVLPDEGKLHEVETTVQEVSEKIWAKYMRPTEIILSIPKFCLSASLNLKNELPDVGMKDVFTGEADLSGITGERNLVVSEAIHKVVVSVDEKGSEAAGASAAVITKSSLPFHVVVDRPFLFSLVHTHTNIVLFSGRVMKPEKC